METISYSKARSHFAGIMNKVCIERSPIIITRQSEKAVVLLSLEEYNSLEETFYLMKSPKNAARLSKALEDLDNNTGFKQVDINNI